MTLCLRSWLLWSVLAVPALAQEQTCETLVTDAVKCGKDVIECAAAEAQCDARLAFDQAACGSAKYRADPACGLETLTDGVECGFERITDEAKCGREKVTSGAKCGWQMITDLGDKMKECADSCLPDPSKCECKGPAKTCAKGPAKSCNKGAPKTCTRPKKCCVLDSARSCASAKSCWKAKSCKVVTACASKAVDFFAYSSVPGTKVTVACTDQVVVTFDPTGKMESGHCDVLAGLKPGSLRMTVTGPKGDTLWEGSTDIGLMGTLSNNTFGSLLKSGPKFINQDTVISWGLYSGGPVGNSSGNPEDNVRAYVYVTRNLENWMGDLQSAGVPDLPLNRWVLPGSHDSGMYTLLELPEGLQQSSVSNLAITQKNDIATQLKLGARFFDFRPGYLYGAPRLKQRLFHQHSMIPGGSYDLFIKDVVTFLKEHPKEIVIAEIAYYGFTEKKMKPTDADVLDTLDDVLKKAKLKRGDYDDYKSKTVSQLLKEDRRLLVIMEPGKKQIDGSYGDGSLYVEPATVPQALEETLPKCLKKKRSYLFQLQSTAQSKEEDIARGIALDTSSGPLIGAKPWLDNKTYGWVNATLPCKGGVFVWNDFYDNALTDFASKASEKRLRLKPDDDGED